MSPIETEQTLRKPVAPDRGASYSCDHCSVSQPKQAQTMLFIVVEDAIQHCTVVFEQSWTTLLTIISTK